MKQKLLQEMVALLACLGAHAQVNSGSNGSDGAFNPTTNTVINMADHPDGIYHYTSINIPRGVTVTFIPNANNTPVVWLLQSNCTITGIVSIKPADPTNSIVGVAGGPGGWRGGNGALFQGSLPGAGFGPGGGQVGTITNWYGGNASHSTLGAWNADYLNTNQPYLDVKTPQYAPGHTYGNVYEMPLLGGSGGSGGLRGGGGGGGGAILIAASGTLTISDPGRIDASGGNGYYVFQNNNGQSLVGDGGAGSGGGIRLIASSLTGNGYLNISGGIAQYGLHCNFFNCGAYINRAGDGRIRLEALSDTFTGGTAGTTTRGFTGIILLPPNQQPQLLISSVAGQPVSSNPSGAVATPDSLISSQQSNPVSIVVSCANVALNSDIIVEVRPASGPYTSAVGRNISGTLASSTATVLINIPRGGGTIQAKVAAAN